LNQKNAVLKSQLINFLVEAGINITPKTLELILTLDSPQLSVEKIVKEINFLPNFNGALTVDILKKLSVKEIQKVLKRDVLNPIPKLDESRDLSRKENSLDFNSEIKSSQSKSQLVRERLKLPKNKLSSSDSNDINSEAKKNDVRINSSAKSSLSFKPDAKDYDFDYRILKDPTGKLYTNGAYEDFYDMTTDKYNTLKNLMKKRPEVLSAVDIKRINRLTNSAEVSTMGLIKSIRTTKNDNFLLVLEDLTGELNVLINKDIENKNDLKTIERTVCDQMIYIEGNYKPSDQGKQGIVFVNSFTKIDIPTDFKPNTSIDPISIALISDTHIGSREFEESLFRRFIEFLNGNVGNKNIRSIAERIKYIIINGDLVDGIGVYPNQFDDLLIPDIYQQYTKSMEFLSDIPEYIKIFYVSGNHEPVRNAIPRPAVPKQYCQEFFDIDVQCLGNPSLINTHGVNTLIYHGEGMHDLNMLIPNLDINKPVEAMKEFLISRHLAPVFGEKTQLAPVSKDWLIIDSIPDIFHTGHVHINGYGKYRNVSLINSGCFQAQTDFMRSFGIVPTIGIVPIVELDTLKPQILDFKKQI
jgi:DNA polymerase II small subunit